METPKQTLRSWHPVVSGPQNHRDLDTPADIPYGFLGMQIQGTYDISYEAAEEILAGNLRLNLVDLWIASWRKKVIKQGGGSI